jgi:tetratricopeptide (TPR) repeat protein
MADNARLEELKRRVQQDPASIAFAALAEEYRRAGRFDEAIATCTAGLQRHPSYLSAHVTLGRAFIEVGRYEDATEELQFVLRLAPENLAAIRGLAEIHHRRGEDAADAPLAPAGPAASPGVSAPIPVSVAPPAPPPLIEVTLPPPVEPVRPVAPHPALVGLEAFLGAIVRARDAARR